MKVVLLRGFLSIVAVLALASCAAPPPPQAAAAAPMPSATVAPAGIARTVYDLLPKTGAEKTGDALYSYALLREWSPRAEAFMEGLMGTTDAVIDTGLKPYQLNVIYLPTRMDRVPPDVALRGAKGFAQDVYNYGRSKDMLAQMCSPPNARLTAFCAGEARQGPYIVTAYVPLSQQLANNGGLPSDMMFLDLSNVHPRAFPTILQKYKDQVHQAGMPDAASIVTLKTTVLSIVLEAADMIDPISSAFGFGN